MYGEEAVKLLKELKNRKTLAPFNDRVTRHVIEETNTLYTEMKNTGEQLGREGRGDEVRSRISIVVNLTACKRNKQCLLAYLRSRLEQVCDYRWEVGAVLPPELKENLSVAELDYFRTYNKMVASYMASIGVDLSLDMEPPKTLIIKVKWVAEQDGTIETQNESLRMRKNAVTYVRRSDVEHLINQGIVEHLIE